MFIAAAFALLHSPAMAQTIEQRLDKARAEINTVENAADRAVYACSRNQQPKCSDEARFTSNAASRALYAVDQAIATARGGHAGHGDMATPPDTGFAPSPSLAGAVAIPTTDFDVRAALEPAGRPQSAGVDPVGAFRFICGGGQLLYDDPIVFPGQPGKSHLHQFYGNLDANARSTYASLRAHGDSTCNSTDRQSGKGFAANRSSYWQPAMLDGVGNVVQIDFASVYYKRRPMTDPACGGIENTKVKAQGKCVGIPNGLRMIASPAVKGFRTDAPQIYFNCKGTGAKAGHYATLADALPNCPVGGQVAIVIEFPECWDGKNLDTPNHHDHLAYGSYGAWGYKRCPATHPYVQPAFQLQAWYPVTANKAGYHLSSDEMDPTKPAGWSKHGDYLEAWDPEVKRMWEVDGCIDAHLNCASGGLGNGLRLRAAAQPFYNGAPSWTNPRPAVPVPPRP